MKVIQNLIQKIKIIHDNKFDAELDKMIDSNSNKKNDEKLKVKARSYFSGNFEGDLEQYYKKKNQQSLWDKIKHPFLVASLVVVDIARAIIPTKWDTKWDMQGLENMLLDETFDNGKEIENNITAIDNDVEQKQVSIKQPEIKKQEEKNDNGEKNIKFEEVSREKNINKNENKVRCFSFINCLDIFGCFRGCCNREIRPITIDESQSTAPS